MFLRALMFACAAALIAGCGSSDDPVAVVTPPGGGGGGNCAVPLPAKAVDQSIVENIPSDFDPTSSPTPTTKIFFTVLLPQRCPGDHFPLILQSHGYGGTRLKTLAANGDLHPADPHFPSINELVQALPFHGYVVISYDERGHGDTVPANGGGYARIIDPRAEVQDARGILDWAYDNADTYAVQTETGTGIAKDVKVGTIGYSYGGGFEMTLAALDPRIDTIVPNGTWYDLQYSLLPGEGVKLSYSGLLCLLAQTGNVSNTPIVATLCNTVGIQGPAANTVRTHADMAMAVGQPTAQPRPVTDAELVPFFFTHGMGYFQSQQNQNKPWGFGESSSQLRAVPALFLQGNRDVLFNLSEAYLNARYFGATGADVRVLSTEGGHMNPLANQTEGTANCGKLSGVGSILAWFDAKLKGKGSAAFDSIPKVCISVADTTGAPAGAPSGLLLNSFPVGSQTGAGGVAASLPTLTASVGPANFASPLFVPVTTIHGAGQVLAGAPRMSKISVAKGTGAVQTAIAFVGVGIVRAGNTILVDDQVTPFVEGDHSSNEGVPGNEVLLPAVGEKLQDGDQVGLLFYSQHVQYSAVVSASSIPNATNVVNTALGTPIPPITSALQPAGVALNVPNIYDVTATNVELPIVIPGTYPGSSLSQ
jgi:ABC-2 type transport system ATP-binding protein